MAQRQSWDSGQMSSTNRWFCSELRSWLELNHLVNLVVTKLENMNLVSDKEHRALKESQIRLRLQHPRDIFHKGLQRLTQAAHSVAPFRGASIQNSLEPLSSEAEFWLGLSSAVSSVVTEFTDVGTLENSETKLCKMRALKQTLSGCNFIFRVGLCLLKKNPLSNPDLTPEYDAGARLTRKNLYKLRAKRVKRATGILRANRQYPLPQKHRSASVMAAQSTDAPCTIALLPLDPRHCLSHPQSAATDIMYKNTKMEDNLLEMPISAMAQAHNAIGDQLSQLQSQTATATVPENIKMEEDFIKMQAAVMAHNAFGGQLSQPQTVPATIPNNIKIEEGLLEMPMTHNAFGDKLSQPPCPAATVPENIKMEEDWFHADCDGFSQQQPLIIPPVPTTPETPQIEGKIPASIITPNLSKQQSPTAPPVTATPENTEQPSVERYHSSTDALVFLDCVKLRHRTLKPRNVTEFYEQLQFANINKVGDPVAAVEAIRGATQSLLGKLLLELRASDTVELRLECGSLNKVLCSIRMSEDYSVAQSFITNVVELLQSNPKTLIYGSLALTVIITRLSTHNLTRARLDAIPYNHVISIKKRWLYDLNQNNNLSLASSLCALLAPKGTQDFMLLKEAQKIHCTLGIPHDRPVALSEVHNFEKLLNATIKIVYCQQGAVHYHVTQGPCRKRVLFVYRHEGRYYGVKNIRAFIGVCGFCEYCHATHSGKGHTCRYSCRACQRTDCGDASGKRTKCNNCRVFCRSLNCLKEHKARAASGVIQCEPKSRANIDPKVD
eukprot:XP_012826937.1 PREDICTED: inactive rhomboid protein 2 isoform X2 [Xenopus tropicalis]